MFCSNDKRTAWRHSKMRPFVFAAMVIVMAVACPVQGQYIEVDKNAVRQAIVAATSDSARARLYGILGWELRFSNQPEALRLADEMIRIATPARNYLRLAEAYRIKGFVKVVNQDIQGCLDQYALGIANAKKAGSHYYLASFYLLTGGMYQDKGDYDLGISYYLDGLREAEESGDAEMIAFAANNTAEMYSDAGRGINITLPYYQRALDQAPRTRNWQFAAMTWSNMAKDYWAAGDSAKAEQAVAQSITCLNKKPQRGYVYATVTTDLAEVLTGLGHYPEAERYLVRAGDLLDSLGLTDNRLLTLSALAKLYVQSGQPGKAEDAAKKLLLLAEQYHSKPHLRDAHRILADVAQDRGDYRLALNEYKAYKTWNDSVFNETKEKSIANAEARMKISRNARENVLLKQGNARLRTRNLVALVAAGILLAAGVWLVVLYRRTRKNNAALRTQKEIIETQSVEKDTLLREIHHRVKNNLQIVSGLLNLQANAMDNAKAKEALMVSQKRVKAISLIHQNLYGFDQLTLIRLADFVTQLYADLRMVYNSGNIQLHCTTDPEGMVLDVETAVPLGLILNECITNSLKYAFHEKTDGVIDVSCTLHEGKGYTLCVRDNGVGLPANFDPQTSATLGFRLIRELTRQLRGNFSYSTQNGTLLKFDFPVKSVQKTR